MAVAIQADEKVLTSGDVAKILGVEQDTVRKYVQRKLLKPYDTIGNCYVFRESECKRFLRDRQPRGNPALSRGK